MNLDVYLGGQHIGHTVPRSRGKKFAIEYSEAVRSTVPDESILLSCSLPTPGPSGPGNARAFLEGLLPEGQSLEVMAARIRGVRLDSDGSPAEPQDVLSLLAVFGRECAGAVVLVPEGEPAPGPGGYRELTTPEIANLIAGLPANPLGTDLAGGVRMSLAGNQPKLLLARMGNTWYQPVDGAATTHIIKPTDAWPLSADNEAIVMGIARQVGLAKSDTWVEDFGGIRAFVAERFDRTVDPKTNAVTRRHQEDMCQAIGLRPRDKYLIGRPSQRMAALLRSVPTAPGTDARALFVQTAFRAIAGDEDGHGKNVGLIIEDGQVALSPLYDSLSTVAYPVLSGRLAAPIGRQTNLAAIDIDALVEEGRACGIGEQESRGTALELADRMKAAAAQLSSDGVDARALESITGIVAERATHLLNGEPMGLPPSGITLSAPGGPGARTNGAATTMDAVTRSRR